MLNENRSILILLFSLCSHILLAQNKWITGAIDSYSKKDSLNKVYLLKSSPLRTEELLDSCVISDKGTFQFLKPGLKSTGLYKLRFKSGSDIVFLSNPKEKLTIKANATDFFYGKAQVTGSKENDTYRQLELIKQRNEEAKKNSGKAYDAITYFDPKFETKTNSVSIAFSDFLRNSNKEILQIRKDQQGTFAADILSGFYYYSFKEDKLNTDTFYDNNLAFQHNHLIG